PGVFYLLTRKENGWTWVLVSIWLRFCSNSAVFLSHILINLLRSNTDSSLTACFRSYPSHPWPKYANCACPVLTANWTRACIGRWRVRTCRCWCFSTAEALLPAISILMTALVVSWPGRLRL